MAVFARVTEQLDIITTWKTVTESWPWSRSLINSNPILFANVLHNISRRVYPSSGSTILHTQHNDCNNIYSILNADVQQWNETSWLKCLAKLLSSHLLAFMLPFMVIKNVSVFSYLFLQDETAGHLFLIVIITLFINRIRMDHCVCEKNTKRVLIKLLGAKIQVVSAAAAL